LKVWICVFDATTAVVHDLAAAGVDGLMANNPDTLRDLIALVRRR
jgi:glycerophosphoryl diester phosphodiesterase